jgi:hypothetical protein
MEEPKQRSNITNNEFQNLVVNANNFTKNFEGKGIYFKGLNKNKI